MPNLPWRLRKLFRRSAEPAPAAKQEEGNETPAFKPEEQPFDQRVTKALDQTLEEIHRINGRLSQDSDRSERFEARLNGLPEDVATIPRIERENTRVLGQLHEELKRTTESIQSLGDGHTQTVELTERHNDLVLQQTELLTQQTAQLSRQTDVLTSLHVAVEDTAAATERSRETLESLENASLKLARATNRLSKALQSASDNARGRELRLTKALERTHKWTVWAVCGFGAASTLALIGVVLVLIFG